MPLPRRTLLTAALAVSAGALTSPAYASISASAQRPRNAPDAEALRAAIAGLPDADATAALVRIGGRDGRWRGSSGVHDLESGRAADAMGRFRAGSTTKVVTAATVLHLAAERRLDLDTPVQRYLPGLFTAAFDPISVRQLLNHTSGVKPGDGFDDPYAHRFDTLPPRQVVASAIAKGPAFTPGTRQQYLNISYTVLGLLIEKVTGHSYASEATRRVLLPAGMRDTYFPGTDPRIRGPHNRGYQRMTAADGTTGLVDVTEWNQADRFAAGDMISTTADLERLLHALFRGRIVPGPQLEEMFTVPADIEGATFSAGLQRMAVGDRVYWFKTGARYGYSTAVAATRDLRRTVTAALK
ncbi:serine hydrolase domain-containing protein [Streptomyces justiciae]|uniref:Serine hydrolase domain-containing protein n=1 Tax=Streptomyces justiciae TaxID=2780140 RepID=A0ABU3M4Q8_9ACTN|nr:serine hydrolase domain-containing protein [Streptomyces justiciae]MDT7846041.1 serine hydrolase domain-containing protein [Streptomyces justiciae]